MPNPNRVILLACSEKKKPVRGPISAYMLYDGPLWSTLRKQATLNDRRKRADRLSFPFSMALSAEHGFIHDGTQISSYDRILTLERAREILSDQESLNRLRRHLIGYTPADILLATPQPERARLVNSLIAGRASEVFLAGGALYRRTMRSALEAIDYDGTIIEPSPARGIGDIRAAMIAFIEASPLIRPKQAALEMA